MCTTAAPALAASMQSLAMCSGVTGTFSLLPTVSPEPVTAQVMNTEGMGGVPFCLVVAGWSRQLWRWRRRTRSRE